MSIHCCVLSFWSIACSTCSPAASPRSSSASPLAAPAAAQLTRVTAALGGVPPDRPNGAGVLSADGRFVAFESEASNLVTGDTNDSIDVFVRDLLTMTTTRVSVANDGQERVGNSGATVIDIGGDGQLDISDDGRTWCSCREPRSRPGTRPVRVPGRDRQLPRHLPAGSRRRHHDAGQRGAGRRRPTAPATTPG